MHLFLEKLLPYKGVTFSEYNRKALIICQKNELLNIMRKTEKGRQRDIQTERQKMKEREREKTPPVSLYFSV